MRVTAQVVIGLEAPDTIDLDIVGTVLEEEIRTLVPTVLLADVTRVHVQRVTAQETDG
jgi:hypothetical protein